MIQRPAGWCSRGRFASVVIPTPAIGRPLTVKFAGVRSTRLIRVVWTTDSLDADPSGLPIDNLAEEPKYRRGPTPLPSKPNGWNAATLQIIKGVLVIQLNGGEVYERALEPVNGRRFGLHHDKAKTTARVRNVVLKGPGPIGSNPVP